MAKVFKPKNILKDKSLTEEQVTEIYNRFKELVNSWNGTEIISIETTEDPTNYWIKFGGECDWDTMNVEGYIGIEMVDDILKQ